MKVITSTAEGALLCLRGGREAQGFFRVLSAVLQRFPCNGVTKRALSGVLSLTQVSHYATCHWRSARTLGANACPRPPAYTETHCGAWRCHIRCLSNDTLNDTLNDTTNTLGGSGSQTQEDRSDP